MRLQRHNPSFEYDSKGLLPFASVSFMGATLRTGENVALLEEQSRLVCATLAMFGLTDKQIAPLTITAEDTVSRHLCNAYKILSVPNRAGLLAGCLARGVLTFRGGALGEEAGCPLNDPQRQLAALLAKGMTQEEIEAGYNIARSTIHSRLRESADVYGVIGNAALGTAAIVTGQVRVRPNTTPPEVEEVPRPFLATLETGPYCVV